jgi:hypothetical protein
MDELQKAQMGNWQQHSQKHRVMVSLMLGYCGGQGLNAVMLLRYYRDKHELQKAQVGTATFPKTPSYCGG